MVKRRKGFSATQSKITSRRLRTATLGTHVPRRSRGRMNADSVGFSSARKQKRAARGYVETILPNTSSGESASQFSRRVSRREFSHGIQRRARMRRLVAVVACVVLVAVVAAGVGTFAFFGSLDSKIGLKNSDASSALVAPKEAADAFYTLVAADLDPAGAANAQAGPDALALVRVDRAARSAVIVSVPATLQVQLKDGKPHQLRDAAVQEGDASLIKAVSNFAGVNVSHLVKIDAGGVASLVDGLGGVQVNVAEEVDDPAAGDVYLSPGEQTLDGKAALTFLRASNFSGGLQVQAANQRELLAALSLRLLDEGSLSFLSTLDKVGGSFGTDMGAKDALGLADALRGMDASTVKGALVPGYETTRDGVSYYVASTDAWSSMMELVKQGQDPVVEKKIASVDPASFTLTVRNGGGITGAAAQISQTLAGMGFKVEETGNTDTAAYAETLVIYKDGAFEPAAQTVVSALGLGRTVADAGFYTFDTDVLLVLGKDWKPSS